jgi:hypothetical protein
MPENNLSKHTDPYEYDTRLHSEAPGIACLQPGAEFLSNGESQAKELGEMGKNPHQSAELIRDLIKFIKSL